MRWLGTRHAPNTDRTIITTRNKLTVSGTLTILKIIILAGTPLGDLYVKVSLEDENRNYKGDICQGYVDTSKQPFGTGGLVVEVGDYIRVDSWGYVVGVVIQPVGTILQDKQIVGGWTGTNEGSLDGEGKVRTIVGTDPAAGVEVSETVPTGARWELQAIRVRLVTSGTVANRIIHLRLDDSSNIFLQIPAARIQTASETVDYNFSPHMDHPTALVTGSSDLVVPLPTYTLGAGYRIKTATGNIGLSDNYGAPNLTVKDKIEI